MKKVLGVCFTILLGLALQANALPPGSYILYIQQTPELYVPGSGVPDVGTDGNYNTSFTFDSLPGLYSTRMIDNPALTNTLGYGTGDDGRSPCIYGDGWAGVIVITLDSAGNFIVNQFNVDVTPGTAGGNWAQFGPVGSMKGTIDAAGNMTLDPTNRWSHIDGPCGGGLGRFNVAPNTASWQTFTTGTTTSGAVGNITGTPIWTDGQGNMWATLVSGAQIGTDWGPYSPHPYYETWKIKIVPTVCTTEGPPGDPTCSDGKDNDCDAKVDGGDPECATSGLSAGTYTLLVQETPPYMGDPLLANVGSSPAWNSSFTFGGLPGFTSARLTDNPMLKNNYGYGTGADGTSPNTFGDGWAGAIKITVDDAGNLAVKSFQMDVLGWTAGGNYAQFGPITNMKGTVDVFGNILLDPTGRRGAIDGPPGGWVADFNIDDWTIKYNTAWDVYTTAQLYGGTLCGSPITTNAKGERWATLVSHGAVGSQWGPYYGYSYCDIWKVKIMPGWSCMWEGPVGSATCADGMDNDCDGLVDGQDPNCGAPCQSNEDCLNTSMYCAKALGDCNGAGSCKPKPTSCTTAINTVCACNGKVYSNDCLAAKDGLGINNTGECLATCTDFDKDTYSIEGGVCGPVDCNMSDPNISPGAPEVCTDGVDNDCDTLIDMGDPDCTLCQGDLQVKIRGGGQRPTTTDLQIQVQFTVLGVGGILSSTASSITVCPGTAIAYNSKAGSGPPPSSGTLDGLPFNPDGLAVLVVNGPHSLTLENKGNGGRDSDRITIQIP